MIDTKPVVEVMVPAAVLVSVGLVVLRTLPTPRAWMVIGP